MSASVRGVVPETRPAAASVSGVPGPVADLRESGGDAGQPPTGSIPDAPGSYQFLRRRGPGPLRGQGQVPAPPPAQLLAGLGRQSLPRTAQMVAQADHVEWVVVDSEVDALILEHSLIQAHLPRYNVRLKDDKSYPWLAVTLNDEWPRPAVVRGRKRKGVRYFGPYGHAGASAPPSTCWCGASPSGPARTTSSSATSAWAGPASSTTSSAARDPASSAVDHTAYDGYVDDLMGFLSGDTEPVLDRLERGDAGGVRRPRVRAGGPAPRPHRRGAEGGRGPVDGVRAARGLRRDRRRRRPARGVRADLPSCAGAGWWATGASWPRRWRT